MRVKETDLDISGLMNNNKCTFKTRMQLEKNASRRAKLWRRKVRKHSIRINAIYTFGIKVSEKCLSHHKRMPEK